MTGMSVVAATGAKTGLPTPTRREYVPVGSITNFIREVSPLGQRSCSNSLLANLSGPRASTVGLGQAGFHLLQSRTTCFFNHSLPPLDKVQEG